MRTSRDGTGAGVRRSAARIFVCAGLIGGLIVSTAAPSGASGAFATVWATSNQTGALTPISTQNNSPGTPVSLGNTAFVGIAISPDASTAWVLSPALFSSTTVPGGVGGVDLATGTSVGGVQTYDPGGLAVSPDGSKVFVGDASNGTITAVSTASPPQVVATATAPGQFHSIVITPDGRSGFAVGQNSDYGVVVPFDPNSPTLALGTPIPLPVVNTPGSAAVVTPDGSTLYVADGSEIEVISLVPTPSLLPPIATLATTLAMSPDGSTLWAGSSQTTAIQAIPTASKQPGPMINVGTNPFELAITPDGHTVYVATGRTWITTVDVLTQTWNNDQIGSGFGLIAITPDQAPVAHLGASVGLAGQTTTLDASGSTVVYGFIVKYEWTFGDGTNVTTSGPVVVHTYGAGTYTVTVVETDTAGTSLTQVFTGQTMSRNGGQSAQTSRPISVKPPITPTTTSTSTTKPKTTTTTPKSTTTTTSTTAPPPPPGSPLIKLDPAVGPPGTVVIVTGVNFPANADVVLVWQPARANVNVHISPTGTLQTTIYILPREMIGPRQLQAFLFPTAHALFLVVPPSVEPAGATAELVYRRS